MLIAQVIAALFATAGLALMVAGVRGRTIDRHPVCRRCGFDLFGLPAERGACPECGAALVAARAVRIGNRQRRSRFIRAGVVLLLPAVFSLGLLGWAARRVGRMQQYEPVWWLQREARAGAGVA